MGKRTTEPAWKSKKPGLERAQCVLKPYGNPLRGQHADYLRTAHMERLGIRVIGAEVAAFLPERLAKMLGGGRALGMRLADDRPYSRIIAAERVERAVELADFFAICEDEGLSVLREDLHWVVSGPMFSSRPRPQQFGRAKTLRGAYLRFHDAGKQPKPSWEVPACSPE